MRARYIKGCSVHRGVLSTLRGYHEYIGGDIMSTSGGVQYIRDIMMHVGDIIMIVIPDHGNRQKGRILLKTYLLEF